MKAAEWKTVRFYGPIKKVVHGWPEAVRKELGAVLTRLQKSQSVGMPDLRQMPSVQAGVAEIRIADRSGIFRTFHVINSEHGILVFHAFTKKLKELRFRILRRGKEGFENSFAS
jgi:phage-related protein